MSGRRREPGEIPVSAATRRLVASIRAGFTLGAMAGLAHGVVVILEQRALEAGLFRFASRLLAQSTTRGAALGALAGPVLCALLFGAIRVLARAPRRLRPPDATGGAILVLAVFALVAVAQLALREIPAWPALRSPGGLAAAAALCLAGLALVVRFGGLAPVAHRFASAAARGAGAKTPLATVAIALGLIEAATLLSPGPSPGLPNLVLITIDTLRADHLGLSGYPRNTSPEIDRFAAEGIRFAHAVAQWPKTTPSMASLLTGTYPRTNGITRDTRQVLPARLVTLAEQLANAGYVTAAVVTNANLARDFGFAQGFDHYLEAWTTVRDDDPERAQHVTDHALASLASRPHDRPFFLWVHYVDPHARYEPPAPYDDLFVHDAHYDPARRAALHEGRDEDMGGIPARARLGDRDEVDFYVAQYDAEIRYADHEIGRLLAALDASSSRDRTAVILTADHGESLGEHAYYFEHGRLPYDDCVRVPLLVRPPGPPLERGRVIDHPVELIDVLPTLLSFAGLEAPPGAEGRRLALVPGDANRDADSAFAFTESGYTDRWQRAVRDSRWKLIQVRDPADRAQMTGSEWELYDLALDPGETKNLARAFPDEVARLAAVLGEWESRGPAEPVQPIPAVPIDRETEQRLRNLGYVE